jgi:protein-disulfide isomerase/uncharacterized membrane protein
MESPTLNRVDLLWLAATAILSVALFGDAMASTLSLGLLVALWTCAGAIYLRPNVGLLLAGALCLASNAYLLSQKLSASGSYAMCGANGGGCSVLNNAPQSELFGLPVTLLGSAFYLGLVALLAMRGRFEGSQAVRTAFYACIPAIGFCGYLGYIAYTLRVSCPFCFSIYVATLLLTWGLYRELRSDSEGFLSAGHVLGSSPTRWFAVVWATLVAVGSFGTAPEQASADLDRMGFEGLAYEVNGNVNLRGSEPLLGNADAPYLVVEWADYGCPHCATASEALKGLAMSNPDVQVRFKPFPLTSQCNPAIPSDGGSERCLTAVAASCANAQGKYWEYQSKLFSNQTYLFRQTSDLSGDLKSIGSQVGLDLAAWETCMTDPSVVEEIAKHAVDGKNAGVNGTPTILVRGLYSDASYVQVMDVRSAAKLIEGHQSGSRMPAPLPPLGQ